MKNFARILLSMIVLAGAIPASAQYYQLANQLPGLIRPALSGSLNYKGFVEATYLKGVGSHNVDILGFSTSQGFKYADWFFMGVGIGADVLFSHVDNDFGNWQNPDSNYIQHGSTATGVMIPIFTDFRFNTGSMKTVSFYADIKVGCSFLVGNDYLRVSNGYLTNSEYFFLRPSIGVRIPVNETGKQAFNVGIDYQLLTCNYWNSWNNNVTLNAIGAAIGYEW